jgi:hypothetical protein
VTIASLMEFVRDPTWQFLGAIIAIIGCLIALAQRQRKRLSYQIVSKSVLLTQSEELLGRVTVLFDSKEVRDICLWVVKIENHGNVPISVEDFQSSLQLRFKDPATVLSTAVIGQNPRDLGAVVRGEASACELIPTLLNPGDFVVIKTLVSNSVDDLEVSARIRGVSKIQNFAPLGGAFPRKVLWSIAVLLCVVVMNFLFGEQLKGSAIKEWLLVIGLFAAVLSIAWYFEQLAQEALVVARRFRR